MNFNILRPVTYVAQVATNAFQSAASSLSANSLFRSTYQIINSVAYKIRQTITGLSQRFSSLASLFSRTNEHESSIESELADFELPESSVLEGISENNDSPFLLTRKTALARTVDEMIEPLSITDESVKARLTKDVTRRLTRDGADWQEQEPQVRSILSEVHQFLRVTETFDYSANDIVMSLLPLAEQGAITHLYKEMVSLFPQEKAHIFARILHGDLMEMSQAVRRALNDHGDTQASSYQDILKQCYRSGVNWKRLIHKIVAEHNKAHSDEEVTGKLHVNRIASHSDMNEIRNQADTIANLMMYPPTQKIKYKQHLIHILTTKSNWSGYADELLKSLQLVGTLGIRPSHALMKAIEAKVNEDSFLEAFHFFSTSPGLPQVAQRYFFFELMRGRLTVPIMVQHAQAFRNRACQLQSIPNQGFRFYYPQAKKQKRPITGTHPKATDSHSGNSGSQQHQRHSQKAHVEIEDASA